MPVSFPSSSCKQLSPSHALALLAWALATWLVPASSRAQGPVPATEPDDFPVRAVVLFTSGAAQITHAVRIEGNQTLQFPVSRGDLDDLLKSLAFRVAPGSDGRIAGVRYRTSRDAFDQQADRLRQPLTVAQFLQSHRGQLVRFPSANGLIIGRILGVENRKSGELTVETLVVVTEGAMRAHPVEQLDGLEFVDAEVAENLNQGLIGLTRNDSIQNRIELDCLGTGPWDVEVSYIVNSPVWRMSWRLSIVGDQASLEGWAHLDNHSSTDWEAVQLELRSGRPFLFHASLFQPILTRRPDLGISPFEIPRRTSVLLTDHGGLSLSGTDSLMSSDGSGLSGEGADFARSSEMGGGGMGGGGMGFNESGSASDQPVVELSEIGPDFLADAATVSRSVVLRVDNPVSVAAGQTAMVPVSRNQGKALEKTVLRITPADFSSESGLLPTRAWELDGIDTDQLVAGPVTVFRDGVFSGDCLLRRPDPGQPLVLEFGRNVELLVTDRRISQQQEVLSARTEGRKIVVTERQSLQAGLTLENTSSADCSVELELANFGTWDAPGQEWVPKGDLLVGRIEVPAGQSATREFSFSRESSKELDLASFALLWQKTEGAIRTDEKLGELTASFLDLKAKIASMESELRQLNSSVDSQIKEQSRLTGQLSASHPESSFVREFSDKLIAGETVIQDLRARIATSSDELLRMQAELQQLEDR